MTKVRYDFQVEVIIMNICDQKYIPILCIIYINKLCIYVLQTN